MRRIEYGVQFKKDFKRVAKGRHGKTLDRDLLAILQQLAEDRPLDAKHRDHALTGDWKDFRDCHIRPDLVLIYQRIGDDILRLARIGSHSDLRLV